MKALLGIVGLIALLGTTALGAGPDTPENAQPDKFAAERQKIMRKLEKIVLPQLDFRQANIVDVINYLRAQSIVADKDSAAGEKGVDFILNLKLPDREEKIAGGDNADSTGLPTVTLSLRNIVLLDAIKYITQLTGLKFRVDGNTVVITPADVVDGELFTSTYGVQPNLADIIKEWAGNKAGALRAEDSRKFFVEAGIPFPAGTSIKYQPDLNLMIVVNTAENLEKLEGVLAHLKIMTMRVRVQVDHVEITDPDIARRSRRQTPTAEELRRLPPAAGRTFSSLAVIARSGQTTEAQSATIADGVPATNEIETVLNCTATIRPGRRTIDIAMAWHSKTLLRANPKLIARMSLAQTLALRDGQTLVLPVLWQEPDESGEMPRLVLHPHFVIITPTLLDPAGRRINAEGEEINRE